MSNFPIVPADKPDTRWVASNTRPACPYRRRIPVFDKNSVLSPLARLKAGETRFELEESLHG